jgi:hypothetical protein
MHNTTRRAELEERFGDMLSAILNTYTDQNSRRPPFGRAQARMGASSRA